jgi:hypothetical protein
VGKLDAYEEAGFDVLPGRHVVQVKLDWGTSPKVVVEVARGAIARLRCGPGSVLGIVVPGRYLTLEGDDRSTHLGRTEEERDLLDNPWNDDPDGPGTNKP